MEFHHRSTLKGDNKKFKTKHATKGESRRAGKGRTERVGGDRVGVKRTLVAKADRRNAARVGQQNRRDDLRNAQRLFSGRSGAAKIVAVVPLCPDVDAAEVAAGLGAGLLITCVHTPQNI